MASGCFPLALYEPHAVELLSTSDRLSDLADNYMELASSGSDGQFDNAASDGMYVFRLKLAASLIRQCVEKIRG